MLKAENGHFFHLELRPREDFVLFSVRDIGREGHSFLVLGQFPDGTWATHKWLISKRDAYISDKGELKSEDYLVQEILDYVDGDLVHKTADSFVVRTHRGLRSNAAPAPVCEECPEMYFDTYEDYEKYFQGLGDQAVHPL
ncbi:MAG: hypothetical protein WC777_04515 [Candidatus Gracilibacteria bacterium]|jgi:hypothetical protein